MDSGVLWGLILVYENRYFANRLTVLFVNYEIAKQGVNNCKIIIINWSICEIFIIFGQ